ncbi:hypothetical protein H6G64_33385 [Calothrix sp. FACHB-156]|nr:hypothetical protein [Calothrix sp. FACHB-156]
MRDTNYRVRSLGFPLRISGAIAIIAILPIHVYVATLDNFCVAYIPALSPAFQISTPSPGAMSLA